MRTRRRGIATLGAALIALLFAPAPLTARANVVPGTTCNLLPADNVWHADISKLPLRSRDAA